MTALYLLGIDKILVSTLCSEGIKKGCLSFRLEMPWRLSNMNFHMAQDDKKASILLPNVVKNQTWQITIVPQLCLATYLSSHDL